MGKDATGICPFCGDVTRYDKRAGRMPVACEKKACRIKAKKMGRKKREPIENFKVKK